jgi:diacylglycerol kinase family enzyme
MPAMDLAQALVAPAVQRHAGAHAPLHLVASDRPGLDLQGLAAALMRRPGVHEGQVVAHERRRGESMADVAQRAADLARTDGGIVLACGGDGTISTVAQAVWPLGVPMAVLPCGTFNYFSRDHGLGAEPIAAFDRLLAELPSGRCHATAVSLVNDQLFIVNCSLGLYSRLLADREKAKQLLGRHRWVAFASGLRSLLQRRGPQALTVVARDTAGQVHERDLELATLFIGCNALQLGQLGLAPRAGAASGAAAPMTVVMMPPLDRRKLVRLVWRALRARLPDEPSIRTFDCTELELHAAAAQGAAHRRLRVAIDGESRWMRLPLRVSRAMRPLWLVAPGEAPALAP